jgi:hypothetical protein
MPRSKNKAPPNAGCTQRDCPNHKHAFRPQRKDGVLVGDGECVDCGRIPVDFDRTRKHNPSDIQYTLDSFGLEYIRNKFWMKEFNETSLNYAKRKGKVVLLDLAEKKVMQNVGGPAGPYDNRNVPIDDDTLANPYHYAFHATATCCRRCVEYWHGIPPDRQLLPSEGSYLTSLVRRFLVQRLPSSVGEQGVYVPARRNQDLL